MPSTVIRKFHYDASSQQLIIEFLSGRRYAYFDVPAAVYTGMRHAQSRGSEVRDLQLSLPPPQLFQLTALTFVGFVVELRAYQSREALLFALPRRALNAACSLGVAGLCLWRRPAPRRQINDFHFNGAFAQSDAHELTDP